MIPIVSTVDDKLPLLGTSNAYNLRPEYCLYDQIRIFNDTLHYGYWVSSALSEKPYLVFRGWWEFVNILHPVQLVICSDTIEVRWPENQAYLILENSTHNLDLLRKYT